MENREAEALLRRLLTGVDPFSGEIFGKDHVLLEQEVREALQLAVRALGEAPAAKEHKGETWSAAEETELRSLYDSGMTMKAMTQKLGRSTGAVKYQLGRMGLDLEARKERMQGEWSPQDREALKRCQAAGLTLAQTAAWFGRGDKEIRAALAAAAPQTMQDPYHLDEAEPEDAPLGWFYSEE